MYVLASEAEAEGRWSEWLVEVGSRLSRQEGRRVRRKGKEASHIQRWKRG
jgi:signal recognition particle subunit SEC65